MQDMLNPKAKKMRSYQGDLIIIGTGCTRGLEGGTTCTCSRAGLFIQSRLLVILRHRPAIGFVTIAKFLSLQRGLPERASRASKSQLLRYRFIIIS